CVTVPMRAAIAARVDSRVSTPRTRTRPVSSPVTKCGMTPAQMWSRDDLPQPVGPTTATTSPLPTRRSTSCSSGGRPGKAKPTPSSVMASTETGMAPLAPRLVAVAGRAPVPEEQRDGDHEQDHDDDGAHTQVVHVEQPEGLGQHAGDAAEVQQQHADHAD